MSVRPAELTLYELPSVIQQFKARSPRSLSEGLKKDDPWLGEVAVAVTNALIRRSVHSGGDECTDQVVMNALFRRW